MISKRYTDFVNLHEALIPVFKLQVKEQSISVNTQVLPILPQKISGKSEEQLARRLVELEGYMQQVLNIMSGQAQFNRALMQFLNFTLPNVTEKFFDPIIYQVKQEKCQIIIKNHEIKLD